MLSYNIRLALKSLKRNPMLALISIGAISLGIAVATNFVAAHHLLSADPLPGKSETLRHVRLDAWNPDRPWDDDDPSLPPTQVTYSDAVALMESDIPTYQTAMYRAALFVHPEAPEERPFKADIRLCDRDFFPMFEVPFAYGGPWGREADKGPESVIVLAAEMNERLFGGGDSVGERVNLHQRLFTVVGVLEPWRPATKFYDIHNDPQGAPEEVYIPFRLGREMEIPTEGNTQNWKPGDEDGFAGLLASEAIWIQLWAQLDSDEQVAAYQSFIDAYALEQRRAGRFARPLNNWLQPMMAWLEEGGAVPPSSRSLMLISLLFLMVCSVNLIGLLLGKFLTRAPEVGVRRALGASRRAIFLQHLVECQLIAIVGGIVGIVLAVGLLRLTSRFFAGSFTLQLDPQMALVGVALAIVSGLIAGVYPAWRVCRIVPAVHLKLQ